MAPLCWFSITVLFNGTKVFSSFQVRLFSLRQKIRQQAEPYGTHQVSNDFLRILWHTSGQQ